MNLAKYNKTIVSVFMTIVVLINTFTGELGNVDHATIVNVVNSITSILGTLLVYFVPNAND